MCSRSSSEKNVQNFFPVNSSSQFAMLCYYTDGFIFIWVMMGNDFRLDRVGVSCQYFPVSPIIHHGLTYWHRTRFTVGTPQSRTVALHRKDKAFYLLHVPGSFDFFGLNHYTSVLAETNNQSSDATPSYFNDQAVLLTTNPNWPVAKSSWLKVRGLQENYKTISYS